MKTPYFIEKIDWTDLRTQKTVLIGVIDELARKGDMRFEDLQGILALIDAAQDYAVDEMNVNSIHVFDFELEEERENPDPDKTKTVFLCSNCGSDNVEMKAWVNPNTDDVGDTISSEEEDCYCNDCDGNHELLSHELKASAKVIGFQVIGEEDSDYNGEIHPLMEASFCIYSLKQAYEMLEDKPGKNLFNEWRLLTIWEGDVEEPTMMFEGDPRTEDLGTTDGHIDPTNR